MEIADNFIVNLQFRNAFCNLVNSFLHEGKFVGLTTWVNHFYYDKIQQHEYYSSWLTHHRVCIDNAIDKSPDNIHKNSIKFDLMNIQHWNNSSVRGDEGGQDALL